MNDEDEAKSVQETTAMTAAAVPLVDRAEPGFAHVSLSRRLRALRAILAFWRERSRQRRRLAHLDARMLADIGVTRTQARREARKRFWED